MTQFAAYPSLHNRLVVITGGAGGIGEALVETFARQGSRVGFLDIQDEAAYTLIQRLEAAGCTPPVYYRCDLTDTAAIHATMAEIQSQQGPVDVLVNNAGYDVRHSIEEVTPELWDQLIAVNLKHQFFVTQAVLPAMKAAQRGAVINMSSISWAIPSTGLPVYVTAKAAIMGMTRTLARELGADNIRVNCVMPGAILTERQRRLWLTDEYKAEVLRGQALQRLLQPEEVARLCLFLAADDSSAITGQAYVVDGGWV